MFNHIILIIKLERNEKRISSLCLWAFIEELLKLEHVKIIEMCHQINMGKETYGKLKKDDKCLSFYERILSYYYELLTEEEFMEKRREWTLRYIRYRKKYDHLHDDIK